MRMKLDSKLMWPAIFLLSACGSTSNTPLTVTMGPAPKLTQPDKSMLPTVHVAPVVGWQKGATPTAAAGTRVNAFATGLDHPRWLYVLSNGDVLVAETQAPAKPDDDAGFVGKVQTWVMKRAGSGASPSANRISLLRDADGDGVAETKTVLLHDLNAPIGMALVDERLYVAATDTVLEFPYKTGDTAIDAAPKKLTDLPGGLRNHHWTKSLIANADGSKLYVGVGSNSNVAENGMPVEEGRAAVWEIDRATGEHRIFASGLRNPVGLAWEPTTHALWVSVNERDELGNDLVPDYMTSVREGGFYGWPYSYYGQHVDDRVKPQNPDLVARAIVPDYALGAHTASLGLCAAEGNVLPAQFHEGMFVGQHGSWNRKPFSGYQVIFVPFEGGKPSGLPITVLSGFVGGDGKAHGRPVGVAIDKRGALLVADDVGNTVWRVANAAPSP
jgi:glucose/arabinose dehydrogenase